jgi:hypothetical protein
MSQIMTNKDDGQTKTVIGFIRIGLKDLALEQWFSTFVRPRTGRIFFLLDEGPL